MNNKGQKAYLFNVDLLIEETTNARAFEQLLRILNKSGVSDFRVKGGVELGKVIEQYIQSNPSPTKIHSPMLTKQAKIEQPVVTQELVAARIQSYISGNRLIRLNINKGLGKKMSIPCRILNFDESKLMLTVYHVDEKQVYTFSLSEIDDFIE
ncbi:hypothetical protein [Paenibacillus abyssi]|uniref:Uncharacterized protein n=1 Tax=Paenibacillus abyssi TaxID=1340531 RepID=A0A917G701_9BACL|nr:hypothetical protein [Paenibacillus abyssi]GGG26197.1 hypothetical protein GCM10010916_48250 [Paenibacillus abyssi]